MLKDICLNIFHLCQSKDNLYLIFILHWSFFTLLHLFWIGFIYQFSKSVVAQGLPVFFVFQYQNKLTEIGIYAWMMFSMYVFESCIETLATQFEVSLNQNMLFLGYLQTWKPIVDAQLWSFCLFLFTLFWKPDVMPRTPVQRANSLFLFFVLLAFTSNQHVKWIKEI